MLKHLTLTALASALVLAIPAVTPALSRGAHYGHARNFGHGNRGHQHFATRGYFGHRLRTVRVPDHHHHHWHWRHGSHGRYGFYGDAGPAYGVDTAAAPGGTCNCLFKEYLRDGSVVFTDRCTKESAIAVPLPSTPRG
jgi:hypothetical protein